MRTFLALLLTFATAHAEPLTLAREKNMLIIR